MPPISFSHSAMGLPPSARPDVTRYDERERLKSSRTTRAGRAGPVMASYLLLDHVQLPKHEGERDRSSGATVSHIKRSRSAATAADSRGQPPRVRTFFTN